MHGTYYVFLHLLTKFLASIDPHNRYCHTAIGGLVLIGISASFKEIETSSKIFVWSILAYLYGYFVVLHEGLLAEKKIIFSQAVLGFFALLTSLLLAATDVNCRQYLQAR